MDINVVGRQMDVSDRFQRHLEDKLDKVTLLAPAAMRIDVEISSEKNPRRAEESERVELTVFDDGNVIRSEARSEDLYSALDLALGKLLERLRRLRDRRKDRHRGRSRSHQVETATVRTMEADAEKIEELFAAAETGGADDALENEGFDGDSPVVIREKTHPATPMTIDDALYQMELVGHDFFFFVDEESAQPKVVYRRKGWNYGVIALDTAAG
ncbi:MAG: ribosome-associated translation inhibitor RaiA [Dermabacter sp.]|nr:ribosome-associated translation inhibitor RaiA [Dermabacter sp.]